MKKRSLLRIVCLFLIFGLLLSTASAASQVQPRYQKIHTITSELLSISLAGRATCCGTADSLDTTCTLDLYLELQQSADGVDDWTTIKTWHTSGNSTVVIEDFWYVDSGYYYRAVTSVIVYSSANAYIESDATESAVFYY